MKVQSLGQIIEESYTLVLAKARRSAVTVELKIDQNVYIMCNEIEIEQVLVNLINNGIYAAQDQENRWVRVILFTQGKEAVLQIWDSGAGVPLQIQHKLFQPFFTTKPVGEGTGLGLAVTKGILDDHGATIALLDHTDHTCFEIRFKSVEKGD